MTMSDSHMSAAERQQSKKALLRWDNEGGAYAEEVQPHIPHLANTEVMYTGNYVISLENLIIKMLAEGSSCQRERALETAIYNCQRAGVNQNPLAIKAANRLVELVNRTER